MVWPSVDARLQAQAVAEPVQLLQGDVPGDRQTGYKTPEACMEEAAESLRGNMCLIAIVCFFSAENCCEKSLTL